MEQRFSDHADATMVLAVFAKGASQQNRQELLIEQITARFADATGRAELQALIEELRGSPGVRSTIEADGADSQIADSGHKIIAPSGPVNTTTRATGGGKILGSGITIIGSTGSPPAPASPMAHISPTATPY